MILSFVYNGEVNSYGYAGRKIGEALQAMDDADSRESGAVPVDLLPQVSQADKGGAWDGAPFEFDGPVVALMFPEWLPHLRAPFLAVYTMWEGKGLPVERVRLVNEHADLCVVPSEWCAEGFRESGVEVPICIVPLGVSLADYPYMMRNGRTPESPYRFLWNGNKDGRKGWKLVYQAFWKAFKGVDASQVELWLHFRDEGLGYPCADENVKMLNGYQSRSLIQRMLQQVDCFVFPSRGEGWGLPPREAAATGLPVIATNYSGLAEQIDHWAYPVRVCKETLTLMQCREDERFLMADPCPNHLAEQMRWCFEHREEAAAFGQRASQWLRANQTYEHTARRLVDAVWRAAC